MIKKNLLFGLALLSLNSFAQVKVLFDATKAEMAGNADWVIDADTFNLKVGTGGVMTTGGNESNPQRIPTPLQSGITSSTSETYWKGALSAWAVDLVKRGYQVETLPYNGKITYGDTTNSQDLKNYKVFVIDEPNIKFTASEKTALINFVKNGGGLFMISDHDVSDRNNDGWDSPHIFNDLFTTNSVQVNPFGITFDYQNFSETTSNIANIPSSTILHGSAGNPSQMQFSNGTSMTLNTANNSSVKGFVYRTGASNTGLTNVMFAAATYGSGKVCALGDSSVPDDGTGDTGDSLYNGYTGDASGNHKPLLINSIIWLATSGTGTTNKVTTSQQDTIPSAPIELSIYPNPAKDNIYLSKSGEYNVSVTNALGKVVLSKAVTDGKLDIHSLAHGVYYIIIKGEGETKSFKVIKE